tara:strand:- start:38 stop:1654 length:1617 start_codon:yes stop_codon:yes gene_type:complete
MEETKIRHFFEYLDYENLTKEDNSFERPVKNEKGIFVAKLNTPFSFYLPKSELCDMFQDTYGNNVINYVINLDSHSEIIQFLENFDTLCINHASDNSKLWFGKELDSEKLIKYYNTLYELSQDEKALYLPISVNTENIEEIIRYNENPDIILSVKIVGIEFFQQTFRWQIQFNKIVDSIDESDDEEDMNFDNLVQSSNIESLDNYFEEIETADQNNTNGIFNFNKPNNIQFGTNQYNSIENNNTSLDSRKLIHKSTNNQSKIHKENLQVSSEQQQYKSEDNIGEYEENYEQNISNDNEYIVNDSLDNDSLDNDSLDNEDQDSDEHQYEDQHEDQHEDEEQYESEHQYEDEEQYEDEGQYENEGEENYENEGEEHYESENEEQYYQKNSEDYNKDEIQESEKRDSSSCKEVENVENKTEEYENEFNKSIINELAEDVIEDSDNIEENNQNIVEEQEYVNEQRETAVENYEDVNNEPNLSNGTIQEITSIISEKRIEAKKYTINASRARRALDTLSHKADEVNKEIELYETKLRACQSSN